MAYIGALNMDEVLEHARFLAKNGGLAVEDDATGLEDLAVMGPAEIYSVSAALAAAGGGILMSSGGTTGQPKLTVVPYHQALDRLLREWRPLNPGDVLLNLFTPGRMWASHYYMQALAAASDCVVIPAGPYGPDEVSGWLPVFRRSGVNALCGTPTALADLAQGILAAGGDPLPVRKLIWMAEPWTDEKRATVCAAFPGIEFWGNYGSVETYVMATSDPGCDPEVLHLMEGQILEPDDEGGLLTRAGSGWTVPTVRYRLGDRVGAAPCRCQRPFGLKVIARADDSIKLGGCLISIGDILRGTRQVAGVTEAQLSLDRGDSGKTSVRELAVHFTGAADPARVRQHLMEQFYDLAVIHEHYPDAIRVRLVPKLERVARTNKVPPAVWRETST